MESLSATNKENTVTKAQKMKLQWRKKSPNTIALLSLTLAALKTPQNPSSKTLILKSSNKFLHLLHPKSPLSLSSSESLLNAILTLLPPLLRSSCDDVVCAAARIVGAASLVSIEVNKRIACDVDIVKGLILNVLRVENMETKKAVCNAILDLSITSVGCQSLLEVSGLNYLMLGILQVLKSTVFPLSINMMENEGNIFLGVENFQDETAMLLLNASATLTNFCDTEQLKNIPRKLKEESAPYLREQWSEVREQLLTSRFLSFSEVKHCYMSNLTVRNLAESIFRLSMDAPGLTYSIPAEAVMGHIFGPCSSSFTNFMLEQWESSPFLIRNQQKDLEAPNAVFISIMQSLTCEETLPRSLSSILRGMVSCPPVALNEIDSLRFLDDVRDTLGSPMIYQQDIRVVRTNLHSKFEEHHFQDSSSNGLEAPRSFSADDIFKCEAAYREGYTIALRGMEFRLNSVAEVAQRVASFFGQPSVGANLYVTPPNSQGLSCHYDDHCVFVCQLYGAKQWTVYPQPIVKLPRLYECRDIPQDLLVDRKRILLREGDVLYLPRGIAHEACTVTDLGTSNEDCESSVHLTLAVDVEPPFEWEGFAHVALYHWSQIKGFDTLTHGTSEVLAISVIILHVAIRLISTTEPMFRKACLVAASSLPAKTEYWLDNNQRTTFGVLVDKINELSSFTDSLKFLQMTVERHGDPLHWLQWLEHLDGQEVYFRDTWKLTSDGISNILSFIYQHKDEAEAAFAHVKSKFCNEVLFDDAKVSFNILHAKYKQARLQYMNGMLSLHEQSVISL
ncbi:Bifunctional lysine-specific demethylase and histidyl-hydroxylase NO66 [Bienertia sinuspersici]